MVLLIFLQGTKFHGKNIYGNEKIGVNWSVQQTEKHNLGSGRCVDNLSALLTPTWLWLTHGFNLRLLLHHDTSIQPSPTMLKSPWVTYSKMWEKIILIHLSQSSYCFSTNLTMTYLWFKYKNDIGLLNLVWSRRKYEVNESLRKWLHIC